MSGSPARSARHSLRPTRTLLRHLRRARRNLLRRANNAEAAWFDLRRGLDTRGKATMAEMRVSGDVATHGTGFQTVNAWHLRRAFSELTLPRDRGFVDVGAGKGKVLLLAAELGFRPVVGIEIVEELCAKAQKNVAAQGLAARVQIRHQDALTYDYGEASVFFLNNPFDADYLGRVTEAISSGRREPAWLLYYNPVWRDVIDKRGDWREARYFRFPGPGRDLAVFERPVPGTM